LDQDEHDAPWPPADEVAAIVNACVVLLIPLALIVAYLVHRATDMNPPVRPPGNYFFIDLASTMIVFVPFAPLALIAAWRTKTHAEAYLAGKRTAWQGVLEGAALGAAIPLAILIGPTLMRPREAPPYLIAYGGLGLIIGVTLGVILRATALLTLKLVARRRRRLT
jgi:hypothetical protein